MTKYARLITKKGWPDEYTGAQDTYYVGACDTCKITDVDIPNQGSGRILAERWIEWHNQEHHHDATIPPLEASAAIPHLELRCSHKLTGRITSTLSTLPNGVCGRKLHLYNEGWDYKKPLLTCELGHHNELPNGIDPRLLDKEVRRQEKWLRDEQKKFKLDIQIAKLEKTRKKLL